jgi:hypothetical protein
MWIVSLWHVCEDGKHEDVTSGIYTTSVHLLHGEKYTRVLGEKLCAHHELTKVLPTTKAMWYMH